MRVYELFEIDNKPRKNNCRYTEYRVYHNALYAEAECVVDCALGEEEITDEEYNKLVEKELDNIIKTLKTHGRYPVDGLPMYVVF